MGQCKPWQLQQGHDRKETLRATLPLHDQIRNKLWIKTFVTSMKLPMSRFGFSGAIIGFLPQFCVRSANVGFRGFGRCYTEKAPNRGIWMCTTMWSA